MFELNSIQEHLINQTNMMYVDIIHTFKNKNENLEQENQVLKKRCKQLELKLNLSEKSKEKGKNQNLYKVSQGSGYYFSLFQRNENSKKKQEFKILNEKEQTQKVFDLQTSEFQLNQETEKKQKKQREIEKTPPKNIIQQKILQVIDQQKNGFDQQLNNDLKQNKNDQEQTLIDQQIFNISKFNPTQNQIGLEQNTDLNQQNEKASQYEQQPLDNNNYIKNDLIVELQEKYQHALIQIQELKNSTLQKDKQINELTQQLSQFYKTLPNSNDTTMTIEHIEETQKEQLKKGQYINQNNQQIEQIQKEELLKELDEERRKNNDLIKNQQMFLQELLKASRSSKNKNTSMNKDSGDEDMDDYDQVIDQTKFLKEWKNNLQQLVEEIVEYEENDRNLRQELSSFAELKQKYDELTMYYTEAYNRLGGALQQIDELNQEVENKNSQLQEQQQHITQLEQGMFNHQNQDNQFQENSQNYLQYEQEILQLNQTIQQLQAQLNSIQQQDYYQRMSQILLENDELKKINSENLEDSQKKDQLIEDLQQQLLTQSQLIGNQEFQERNGQQEQQLQDDLQQKPQLQVDFNK